LHDFNDNIILFYQIAFMFELQHGWVIVTVSDKKNTNTKKFYTLERIFFLHLRVFYATTRTCF